MQHALDCIGMLCDMCTGSDPAPCVVASLGSEPFSHLKSSVVLTKVRNELLPSLVGLEEERTLTPSLFPSCPGKESAVVLAGNPFFKIMVHSIVGHSESFFDGGWYFASLVVTLLRKLLWIAGGDSSAVEGRRQVALQLSTVNTLLSELLMCDPHRLVSLEMVSRVTNRDQMRLFTQSRLRLSNVFANGDPSLDRITEAVIDAISLCASGGDLFPQRVRFRCVPQLPSARRRWPTPTIESIITYCGVVLDWQLPLEAQLLWGHSPPGVLPTLLFDCCLDDSDLVALQQLQATLRQLDVKLVASQRTMSATIKDFLFREGIVALERLSIRSIDEFRMISGCRVVSSLEELKVLDCSAVIGAIKSLRPAGGSASCSYACHKMIVEGIEGRCAIHTILMHCSDVRLFSLIEEQVASAFRSLCALFGSHGAFVVDGCGVWELQVLLPYLRHRLALATSTARRGLSQVINAVEETFREYRDRFEPIAREATRADAATSRRLFQLVATCPTLPVQGCSPTECDVWRGLPKNQPAPSFSVEGRTGAKVQSNFVDSFECKKSAITNALGLVTTLLQIDECFVERAGVPSVVATV